VNSHRARKALDLFRAVIRLPENERSAFLENECGSDLDLRGEVEILIASDSAEWSGLDRPPLAGSMSALLQGLGDMLSPGCLAANRYRIIEPLGEGGMGMVYRAVQDHPQREVALKVMKSTSSDLVRRFEREIDILARLRHAGIAQIYDAGEVKTSAGNRPFLAMELVRGVPINAYVRTHGLDIAGRLELLAKVCDAIQYAHQAGVIHRDLKPENILVEQTMQGPFPRVLDYGVGAITDHSALTLATEPGCLIGTIAYMAPEQVAGQAGTQSDVYSLGVILYELLCGELPIQTNGVALGQVIRRLQEQAPVPISRSDPRLGGDIETIVMKTLEKEPGRRYASADALATDIRRHLRHEPILARRPSARYVVGRFARRHRLLVGVSSVAALAVIVAVIGMFFAMIRARETKESAVALAGVLATRALPMLTDQVGTKAEREDLAEELHAASLSLLRDSPEDPTVLSVYADSLRQLSRVALDDGDGAQTLELCVRALAARERASNIVPGNLGLISLRSIDMVLIGDAFKLRNQFDEMKAWYERAEGLQAHLAADKPIAEHLENLAWSQHRLWHIAIEAGRWSEAAGRAERMMELSQRVVTMRPGDLTALDGLREAHISLAFVEWGLGDHANATVHLEKALALGRQLCRSDPHNRIYLCGHVSNLSRGVSWYCGVDGLGRGRKLADEALPLAQRYYDGDSADWTAIKVLAGLWGCVALLAEAEGRTDLAVVFVDRQMEFYKGVSQRLTRGTALGAYSDFQQAGALYHRLGRETESRAAWQESARLLELDANQPDACAESLARLAQQLLNCDWPELRDANRALELAKRAVAKKSQDADYWQVLADCYQQLGESEQAHLCQAKMLEISP